MAKHDLQGAVNVDGANDDFSTNPDAQTSHNDPKSGARPCASGVGIDNVVRMVEYHRAMFARDGGAARRPPPVPPSDVPIEQDHPCAPPSEIAGLETFEQIVEHTKGIAWDKREVGRRKRNARLVRLELRRSHKWSDLTWAVSDVILDRLNPRNGQYTNSAKGIAEILGCTDRAVETAIDRLLQCKFLVHEPGEGQGKASSYAVLAMFTPLASELAPNEHSEQVEVVPNKRSEQSGHVPNKRSEQMNLHRQVGDFAPNKRSDSNGISPCSESVSPITSEQVESQQAGELAENSNSKIDVSREANTPEPEPQPPDESDRKSTFADATDDAAAKAGEATADGGTGDKLKPATAKAGKGGQLRFNINGKRIDRPPTAKATVGDYTTPGERKAFRQGWNSTGELPECGSVRGKSSEALAAWIDSEIEAKPDLTREQHAERIGRAACADAAKVKRFARGEAGRYLASHDTVDKALGALRRVEHTERQKSARRNEPMTEEEIADAEATAQLAAEREARVEAARRAIH